MKRLLIFAALALTLGGCQSTRWVTVPCLTGEQFQRLKDALPPKVGSTLTGDAQRDVKIIAESNVRLRGYSESLLELLKGCTAS